MGVWSVARGRDGTLGFWRTLWGVLLLSIFWVAGWLGFGMGVIVMEGTWKGLDGALFYGRLEGRVVVEGNRYVKVRSLLLSVCLALNV